MTSIHCSLACTCFAVKFQSCVSFQPTLSRRDTSFSSAMYARYKRGGPTRRGWRHMSLLGALMFAPGLWASPAENTRNITEFTHGFQLISDHSTVRGFSADQQKAHRALLTWQWAYDSGNAWSFAGDFKALRGDNGEGLTDNVQGISNIDAEPFSKLYQAYAQYQFSDVQRMKCGQVDANLEFAMVPVAGAFISPPLGITPTAIALPTYNKPALSCSYFYEPQQGWQAMTGVFAGRGQTDFTEQFYIAETRYVTHNARMSAGYWHHHGDWKLLNDAQLRAISGWYINYQYQWHPQWTGFVELSTLNDDVDETHQHRMLGVVFSPDETGQQLGVMLSQVSGPAPSDEHLLEAYWLLPLTTQLQLQPVIQRIAHKADERSDSTVATLRLLLQF